MHMTGLVRRVDDLGRIVIPKEIRKRLNITEGEPMMLYIENDCVTFKKYDFLKESRNATKKTILLYSNCSDFVNEDTDLNAAKRLAVVEKLKEALTMLETKV